MVEVGSSDCAKLAYINQMNYAIFFSYLILNNNKLNGYEIVFNYCTTLKYMTRLKRGENWICLKYTFTASSIGKMSDLVQRKRSCRDLDMTEYYKNNSICIQYIL